MNDDLIWRTKLAARIHDPAEKALFLDEHSNTTYGICQGERHKK